MNDIARKELRLGLVELPIETTPVSGATRKDNEAIDGGDGSRQFSSLTSRAERDILEPKFQTGDSMNVIVPPLPYEMDALAPHLSRRTLAAHFGRHHVAYVDKTRKLIEGTSLESASLEPIIRTSQEFEKPTLFNAAAQAWNHTFYWMSMHPMGGGEAKGPIAGLIEDSFGSQSEFRQQFVSTAGDHFGSGWVWLVLDGERLRITATSNAGTPLVTTFKPLITIDVWEHAYYLDYQHRRLDYISAFMAHLLNWDFANRNLAAALDQRKHSHDRSAVTASLAARSSAGSLR